VPISFKVINLKESSPTIGVNTVYLSRDNWDDFGYGTTFYAVYFGDTGTKFDLGSIKIGKKGMFAELKDPTQYVDVPKDFFQLDDDYFSLGSEAEFYEKFKEISYEAKKEILGGLNDVIFNSQIYQSVCDEPVFLSSLSRTVSKYEIEEQFQRIVDGGAKLTKYNFFYKRNETDSMGGVSLEFNVNPDKKPSTNIHVLIGRNGSGKTSLLNDMLCGIVNCERESVGEFYSKELLGNAVPMLPNYFSSITSVSYSVFDSFIPPDDQKDPNLGICFNFIGMKKPEIREGGRLNKLLSHPDLSVEFITSLKVCFSNPISTEYWKEAILKLCTDSNFAEMQLGELAVSEVVNGQNRYEIAKRRFEKMSSGHAVVLLTITKLVETMREKTLLLMDEPEGHLHPPLLSAFIRALSDLLIKRNGVAIIATHSPVILQEVPRNSVWKIRRSRTDVVVERPDIETFGENVGVLTREVFGLEVDKSGFHDLLEKMVESRMSHDDIMTEFDGQLGMEGKAMLRAMLVAQEYSE